MAVRRATIKPWRALPRPNHLTTTQAAQALGIEPVTVRVLIHRGELERVGYGPRVGGGCEGLVNATTVAELIAAIRRGEYDIRAHQRNAEVPSYLSGLARWSPT